MSTHPTIRDYRGQTYVAIRTMPYTRRDGSQTTLTVWQSHCPTCGEVFTLTTPTTSAKWSPTRRCPAHRSPGRRIAARDSMVNGDRTAANRPSRAAVIDLMAQRGHSLFSDYLDDYAFWRVAGEQLAEVYRHIWPTASTEMLAEVASFGGMLLELAVIAKTGELRIADARLLQGKERR